MLKTKLLIPLTTVIGISAIAPMSTLTSCGMQNTIAIQLTCEHGTLKTPVLMIQTGQTYGEIKNNLDTLVQADDNYGFSHWETLSGDEITDDYIFDKGETINAKCIKAQYEVVTEAQWQSAMDKLLISGQGYFPCLKMTSSDDHITIQEGAGTMIFTQLAANCEDSTWTVKSTQEEQTLAQQAHVISDGIVMHNDGAPGEKSSPFGHDVTKYCGPFSLVHEFGNICYNLFPHFTYDKNYIYHFNADLEEVLHASADFGFVSNNLTYVRIEGWLNTDEDPEPEVLLDVVAHLDYSYSKISLPTEFSEAIEQQNFDCKWDTFTFNVTGGSYTKDDTFSVHFTNIPEGSTKLTVYNERGEQPGPDSWDWKYEVDVGKNGVGFFSLDTEICETTSNSINFKEPLKSTDSITIAFKPNANLSEKYTFKWS